MRVFDGCTEFGSETKAFRDRGHEVVTLGITGDVTIKCDIRQYFPSVYEHYDFMWFSPPCGEFSKSHWKEGKCKDRRPDMSIVWACFRIIDTCKPPYWIIENPQGCLRHFIGMPQVTVNYGDYGHYCKKPTDLWGVFPWFWSETPDVYVRGHHSRTAFKLFDPGSPAQRAMVPYALSLAICKAIENQLQSSDYSHRLAPPAKAASLIASGRPETQDLQPSSNLGGATYQSSSAEYSEKQPPYNQRVGVKPTPKGKETVEDKLKLGTPDTFQSWRYGAGHEVAGFTRIQHQPLIKAE